MENALQLKDKGHFPQFGFLGEQILAPNSIML